MGLMTLSKRKYAEAFEVLVVGKLKRMNRQVSNFSRNGSKRS